MVRLFRVCFVGLSLFLSVMPSFVPNVWAIGGESYVSDEEQAKMDHMKCLAGTACFCCACGCLGGGVPLLVASQCGSSAQACGGIILTISSVIGCFCGVTFAHATSKYNSDGYFNILKNDCYNVVTCCECCSQQRQQGLDNNPSSGSVPAVAVAVPAVSPPTLPPMRVEYEGNINRVNEPVPVLFVDVPIVISRPRIYGETGDIYPFHYNLVPQDPPQYVEEQKFPPPPAYSP